MTDTLPGDRDTAGNKTDPVTAVMTLMVHDPVWSGRSPWGKSRVCGSPEEGQSQLGGREGAGEVRPSLLRTRDASEFNTVRGGASQSEGTPFIRTERAPRAGVDDT